MGAAETHKKKKRNDHDHKKHEVANKPHPTREKNALVWNNTYIDTSLHRPHIHPHPPTASPRTGSRGKRAEGLKKRTPNNTGQMQKKKKKEQSD